jgi:hypothetical protein
LLKLQVKASFDVPPGSCGRSLAGLFDATPIPILRRMQGVDRNYSTREAGQSVARREALARLMDAQFVLPGTDFRFALDPLVGLIRIVGGTGQGIAVSPRPQARECS